MARRKSNGNKERKASVKSYNIYIFDLDGTITNTMSTWLNLYRKTLLEFGIKAPDDKTLIQHTHDWNEMVQLGLPMSDLAEFIQKIHQRVNSLLVEAPFHQGAYETLEGLKNNGKKIAVFSTMDRPIFEPALKHRNLSPLVDCAVAGTDVAYRKPHPAGILKVLNDLKVSQRECRKAVYIGDKDTDIQAAHNAGIDGILFYPVEHQIMYEINELKKHKPEYIIYSLKELLVN